MKKTPDNQLIMAAFCAQEWIRTITSLRTLRPEHSASTNFATWAGESEDFSQFTGLFSVRAANIGGKI